MLEKDYRIPNFLFGCSIIFMINTVYNNFMFNNILIAYIIIPAILGILVCFIFTNILSPSFVPDFNFSRGIMFFSSFIITREILIAYSSYNSNLECSLFDYCIIRIICSGIFFFFCAYFIIFEIQDTRMRYYKSLYFKDLDKKINNTILDIKNKKEDIKESDDVPIVTSTTKVISSKLEKFMEKK